MKLQYVKTSIGAKHLMLLHIRFLLGVATGGGGGDLLYRIVGLELCDIYGSNQFFVLLKTSFEVKISVCERGPQLQQKDRGFGCNK